MKKRFGVVALAAAAGCAVIFSGCAGCGANGKTNEAAFSSNWYADTSFPYIQPTFDETNASFGGREEINYTVTLDTEKAGNSIYSVEYGAGTYSTLFYATKFDKTLVCEEYQSGYPDDLIVYYYKTELKFDSVSFKMKSGGDPATFGEQSLVTECYFTDVSNHLRPLYATIDVDNYDPADYQPNALENTYKHVSQKVTTCYNFAGSAAKTVIVDRVDSAESKDYTVDGLDKTNNSLIDVCGLNVALRAMQLGTSLAQTISVYSPSGRMQDFTFTGSALAMSDEERTAAEGVLEGAKLYESAEDKKLSTVCVTALLNEDMNGASQRYWFAAVDSLKNNRGRATMVKMTVPAPFSLGSFEYKLDEVVSTLYNG